MGLIILIKINWNSIRWQIISIVIALILFVSTLIGIIMYQKAAKELRTAGIGHLQQVVAGAMTQVKALDQDVKLGHLTLQEAQERARIQINGPLKADNKNRDLSQSSSVYKKEGYMWAYDDNYVSVMHPFGLEGQNHKDFQIEDGTYLIRQLIKLGKNRNPDERIFSYQWKNPGEEKSREQISYVDYYEPWGWTFGIAVYPEEFYGSLPVLRGVLFGGILIFSLISSLIFTWFINRKLKIVSQINAITRRISEGDLTVVHVKTKSKDEFSELSSSINTMASSLKTIIGKVNDSALLVASFSEQLLASMQQSDASNLEIADTIKGISSSAEILSAKVNDNMEIVMTIVSDILSVSNDSSFVEQVSEKASEKASYGEQSIDKVKSQMDLIQQSVNNSSQEIEQLVSRSAEIYKISSSITEIASQTNLLALNAAIEAARAGEHGSSFTVVAAEVRKLANQSSLSANQISNLIQEIQHHSMQSVQAMQTVTNEVHTGTALIHEAGISFKDIVLSSNEVFNQIQEMTGRIQGVTLYAEQVRQSFYEMNQQAINTVQDAKKIARSTEEQILAMAEISSSSEHLSNLSGELTEVIGTFKINDNLDD